MKARLEDRERLIAAFRERCQKLERVAEAARPVLDVLNDQLLDEDLFAAIKDYASKLEQALAALDKEGK